MLKKKIKNYLLNNNINSLEQLTDHIEELKASKDLSIKDRDMLFKLVYCVVNKKDSLLSFFAENWKTDITDVPVFVGFYNTTDWQTKGEMFKNNVENSKLSKESLERLKQPKLELNLGKKETEGKLYYELSWEFIEEMAKRMANNKGDKYPLYNWKNPMTPKGINDLKQAINRHHIEVMKGNYKDGEELLGHVVSYACNSMMLWEQLRDNDENK